MKKTILTVLFCCLVGSIYGQSRLYLQQRTQEFVQHAERYSSSDSYYLPDEYIGSPYRNETFLAGTIYENNQVISSDYFLRYNAIEDEIEAKENIDTPDTEILVLTKSPEIFVKIVKDLFVYNASDSNPEYNGYFQVVVVGNNYNLYKKHHKKYYPAKKAKNSFEKDVLATYKDKPLYYIVNGEGVFYTIPDSKNKRIKIFGNKSAQINKFVKHSKLDITKESDFIKAFKYFDSFSDTNL